MKTIQRLHEITDQDGSFYYVAAIGAVVILGQLGRFVSLFF